MSRILVGMSGGVDSSVAAALLVRAGHTVVGAYMKNWTLDVPGARCPWADDLAYAKRTAVRLGIDFRVYDFQDAYKREVVDYLVEEYKAGRTPNPDVMCNQEVKFGLFLDAAEDGGFDYIATGHYASRGDGLESPNSSGTPRSAVRATPSCAALVHAFMDGEAELPQIEDSVHRVPTELDDSNPSLRRTEDSSFNSSHCTLLRPADEHKDQTYFLYRMTQRAVDRTLFPLGELTKPQVRALAEELNLPSAKKPDSQGICFVGEAGIREFLRMYVEPAPGHIIDADTGKVLGHHDGAIFFTLGQRKGLGLTCGGPVRYVVGKDMAANEVYVSTNPRAHELRANEIRLDRTSWIAGTPPAAGEYHVRCRHTGALLPAQVEPSTQDASALVRFSSEAENVAPGQSVVVYAGEDARTCLGGGIAY